MLTCTETVEATTSCAKEVSHEEADCPVLALMISIETASYGREG